MNRQTTLFRFQKAYDFIKDARIFQIVFLSSFLLFGIFSLGWKADTLKYAVILTCAVLTQVMAIKLLNLKISSLRSAIITALGLCLLLQSGELWVLGLATILAIASKFIIRLNRKHLFNPANFGIISSIIITQRSWISPGQWGSDVILLLFFGAAGLMILMRISRLETGITFFLTYFALLYAYNVWYLGWEFEVVMHKMTNGSLLLFTFFMITDPMTIPNNKKARIIWAIIIAAISFIAGAFFQLYTAPIWILFFFTPITVVFDRLWSARKYEWGQTRKNQSLVITSLNN